MSYSSKFTEIFDISLSNASLESVFCQNLSSTPEITSDEQLSKTHIKPIAIPKKRELPMTPPHSPHNSEALSYKFKSFLSSISRKRDRSVSPATLNKAISTK